MTLITNQFHWYNLCVCALFRPKTKLKKKPCLFKAPWERELNWTNPKIHSSDFVWLSANVPNRLHNFHSILNIQFMQIKLMHLNRWPDAIHRNGKQLSNAIIDKDFVCLPRSIYLQIAPHTQSIHPKNRRRLHVCVRVLDVFRMIFDNRPYYGRKMAFENYRFYEVRQPMAHCDR